jgi:hypothetical protein
MMQVTAIVLSVLACGTAVKLNRAYVEQGLSMPDAYYRAISFREHGPVLFFVVILWAAAASYFSSPLCHWKVQEHVLARSGLLLTFLFLVVGSVLAISGAIAAPLPS